MPIARGFFRSPSALNGCASPRLCAAEPAGSRLEHRTTAGGGGVLQNDSRTENPAPFAVKARGRARRTRGASDFSQVFRSNDLPKAMRLRLGAEVVSRERAVPLRRRAPGETPRSRDHVAPRRLIHRLLFRMNGAPQRRASEEAHPSTSLPDERRAATTRLRGGSLGFSSGMNGASGARLRASRNRASASRRRRRWPRRPRATGAAR